MKNKSCIPFALMMGLFDVLHFSSSNGSASVSAADLEIRRFIVLMHFSEKQSTMKK